MAASQTTAATESAASGVLIFDGDCGFCTAAARKFGDFAGESARVMPWQALDLDDYGLSEAEVASAVYWSHNGQHHRGADAVAQGLRACNPPWNIVGTVMATPPFIWLARAIYPLVAKYRYRLPGSTNACRIN